MTHTICGQSIIFVVEILPGEPVIQRMTPYCERCQIQPPEDELSPGRPWELVDDDGA